MGGLAMQNTKQKKSNFRASAVPLVTVDPYFSVGHFQTHFMEMLPDTGQGVKIE